MSNPHKTCSTLTLKAGRRWGEDEGQAWDAQLDTCRREALHARRTELDAGQSVPADIQQQAEINLEALLDVDPGVFAAREQFFGCLAEAGYQVPHGVAQRALTDFVLAKYGPLLETFWFGDAPWPGSDLEDLRAAQEWERGLGAAVFDR